jgi:hypothetical protein
MSRSMLVGITTLMLTANAANGDLVFNTVTIDFDGFTPGEVIVDDLAGFGILVEPISHLGVPNDPLNPLQIPTVQSAQLMQDTHGDGRPSTGNVLAPSPTHLEASGVFRLWFVDPSDPLQAKGVQSVSAGFFDIEGSAEGNGTFIRAFDLQDALIQEVQPSGTGNGNDQMFGISVDYFAEGNGIYSVEFSLGNPGDAVWFDNLTIVTVIPEPSTALMMLIGVWSAARRRRSQAA